MPKKIRTHAKSKVPFQLIAGEDDRAAGAVSFRYRDGSRRTACRWPRRSRIVTAIQTKAQV